MSGSEDPRISWGVYWDPEACRFEGISAEDAAKYRDGSLTSRFAEKRRYLTPDEKIELTPVHGERVAAHFRIKDKKQAEQYFGSGVGESRRHYITKHVLALIYETDLLFGFGGKVYSTPIVLRRAEVEMSIGSLRLDVAAFVEFGNPKVAQLFRSPLVALEVRFDHATEEDKIQQLADVGVSVLEIFLDDPLPDSASTDEAEQFKKRMQTKLGQQIKAELLHAESAEERYHRQQLAQAKQKEKTLLDKLDFAGNRIQNLELTKDRFLDQLDQATAEKRRLTDLLEKAEARADKLEREPTLARLWRKLIS